MTSTPPRLTGLAIAIAAELAVARRQPGESAIELLDRVCAPYAGARVDFKAEEPEQQDDSDTPFPWHPDILSYTDPNPKVALGHLMVEAFAPHFANTPRYAAMLDPNAQEDDGDGAIRLWSHEVSEPFMARYRFTE